MGYKIDSNTHRIPIIMGQEKTALNFGKYLFNNGVYAQPIRFPTVPKNKARIRLSVTSWLTNILIDDALSIFESAGKKFKIL